MTARKVGLAPVAAEDARLFILGSLPGDASLAARAYYAHPTNQFWRLLGAVLDEPLHALDWAGRAERLAARRIGLWDVIAGAERAGSLDQSIRAAALNPLEQLRRDYPALSAIAFNGRAAAVAGRRALGAGAAGLALIDLPSSSAAHTMAYPDKLARWRGGLGPLLGLAHGGQDGMMG